MILRLSLFGKEAVSLEFWTDAAVAEIVEEETPAGITGGSAQNFERDAFPPDPMREEPWEDRRRLGFG